jgi:alkane 1-monooxygenase
MTPWTYLLNLTIPTLAIAGVALGGPATFLAPVAVFVVVVLLEIVLRPRPGAPALQDDGGEAALRPYDAVILLSVPVQVGLVLLLLWQASRGAFEGPWLLGAVLSVGLGCGGLGINVGHELGHRRSAFHRAMAKVLLSTSLYAHFYIEHNRGHHSRVATPDDPASARRGEWLYAFWARSIVDGACSAWRLEAHRLRARGQRVLSLRNECLRLWLVQGMLVVAAALVFGPFAAALWCLAALGGVLLLETVNYVEHYGLQRAATERGWEAVRPEHSWNSDHPLGRVLLFELTRHSDHHAHPTRPYPQLRSFPEAPQLPTGYPGMILLALCPPLFFAVMDRRVDALAAQTA